MARTCLGFESGVRDFSREAGRRLMVGPSMENMGGYGGFHREYPRSFHEDIDGIWTHASEFIPGLVT